METSQIRVPPYVRLPSETGKGIEFGKIPSRIKVSEEIKTLLLTAKKQENQPLVLFLIGEWGEGKTTLYDRYLRSKEVQEEIGGFYVLDVQTDILVKYAKMIFKKELFPSENIDPGYRLLAALFLALRHDHYNELKELLGEPFPGERSYQSLRDYVNKCLTLIKRSAIKKNMIYPLVIFIDEFETFALVAEDEILKEFIIEGLTKIINGKINSLFENKTSVLHFIFSITPPAFARVRALAGDIEGRFMQRVKRIHLYPLSKEERLKFANELLKYMWNNQNINIDTIFLPPSVLNPVVHSTIGNTRALQQAMTALLRRELSKGGSPIEYTEMMNFLKESSIVVAGVEATLINSEMLTTIYAEIDKLQEDQENPAEIRKVFEFIISTFGAVPLENTERYLRKYGLESFKVKYYLERLNKIFRRSKPLGASIGTNSFVYKGRKYEILDQESFFTRLASTLYKVLEESDMLDSTKDSLVGKDVLIRQFIDSFLWIDEHGKLSLFWPQVDPDWSHSHTQYLAEMLKKDETDLEEVYRSIDETLTELTESGKLKEVKGYYLVSPALINSLYFSPELMYIDFISDRNLRFKIWKYALQSTEPKHMFNGILAILVQSGLVVEKVLSTRSATQNGAYIVALKSKVPYKNKSGAIPVNIVFSITTANLTEEQVEQTYKLLRQLNQEKGIIPQVVIFVYQGDMLERARKRVTELPEEFLSAPLFINAATQISKLQLISLGLLLQEFGAETPHDVYKKMLEIMEGSLPQEEKEVLNIQKLLAINDTLRASLRLKPDRIIEILERFHILIPPITRAIGRHDKSLPEKSLKAGLKHFLVVPDAHEKGVSLEKVLLYSDSSIRRWYFFSQKGGLLGEDIESERELEKRAELLYRNGYLIKIPRGGGINYKIVPITELEDKILKFIQRYESSSTGVSKALIENYFIEEQKGTLNFLLEIMEEKGLIIVHQEGSYVRISQVNKELVTETYKQITEKLNDIKNSDLGLIKTTGYFCDSKERGIRIKHVPTYLQVIERFLEKAEEYLNSSTSIESLSKAMVFTRLSYDLLLLYDGDAKSKKGQRRYRALIHESDNFMRSILTGYGEILESASESQKLLEERLNSTVLTNPISVELKEISTIEQLHNTLKDIYQEEYDLAEYEQVLTHLWASLVPSKQDKHRRFPFYYNKDIADELKFNYKIYKMYEQIGTFLLKRHPPLTSEELKEILRQVDRKNKIIRPSINEGILALIQEIDDTIDQSMELNRKSQEIRDKLKKIAELADLSVYIPDIKSLKVRAYSDKYTSLKEIRELVKHWKERIRIDKFLALMEQLEESINKINESKQRIFSTKSMMKKEIEYVLSNLESTRTIKEVLNTEIESLNQLSKDVDDIENGLNASVVLPELKEQLSTITDPYKRLKTIKDLLNEYQREIDSNESKYYEIKQKLGELIDKINSRIHKKLIDPKMNTSKNLVIALEKLIDLNPLRSSGGACTKWRIREEYKNISKELSSISRLIDQALSNGEYSKVEKYLENLETYTKTLQELVNCYLTVEEQEVFFEYLKIKSSVKKLTLKQFIEIASERLGKDVKDTFFRLVERDIIILYI
ncbi:hypothetical protein [Thermococcus sp.]|uniref:hypothetical protein n=1 Tax=Thermococcus sp. TaxID=35749 RepID=UPI0025D8C2FA|nr:hypothetical protein [Thermococcus sp.]